MADKIPSTFAIQFHFDRNDFVTFVMHADNATAAALHGHNLMNQHAVDFRDRDTQAVCRVNMDAVRYMRVLQVGLSTPHGWRLTSTLAAP